MDPYGGGQQQMMSMSMSSACACVALGGVAFFMYSQSQKPKPTTAPPTAAPEPIEKTTAPSGGVGSVTEGLYNVRFGDVEMIVNPGTCKSTAVGFGDPTESDKGAWFFKAVPNRPGFYYVSSEHRTFKKGCDLKYLTAPADCKGSPVLDNSGYADRQYWQVVPQGDKFMLKNASCTNKRGNEYLLSSGVKSGWNDAQMAARFGSPYSLTPFGS